MADIGRLHEHLPGHEAFDEHGLERVKVNEVLRERFEIVTHYRIASGVRFKGVLVEAGLSDSLCRGQAAGRGVGGVEKRWSDWLAL